MNGEYAVMEDSQDQKASCCCGPVVAEPCAAPPDIDEPWIDGTVDTPVGGIPRVPATLTRADRFSTWKVRCGIGRMHYTVPPGLYAVGKPTTESHVFVSANFKLSFDHLRSKLGGIDAWILVLDTRGINVWCAAGKGTFGTDEIVKRVEVARLAEIVSHRRLVVPQLGAPGVAGHEVTRRCRFHVAYGPVRAEDLPAFLDADMKATPEMRRVRFPIRDRIVLVPVELVMGAKLAAIIAVCFLLLGGLGTDIYSVDTAISVGLRSAALFLGTFVTAVVLTPALLPWLPGRPFAIKGVWIGVIIVAAVVGHVWAHGPFDNSRLGTAAWLLMIPAVASFVAMNFTGASTYTSLSGVRREMRVAVPIQAACAAIGVGMWLVGRFV